MSEPKNRKLDISPLSLAELRGLAAEVAALITEKTKAEKVALLAEFEARAAASGFVLADLFAGTAHAPTGKSSAAKPKADKGGRGTVAPKYQNPENALETWSGRGRQTAFVRDHIAKGGKLEDLAIKTTATA